MKARALAPLLLLATSLLLPGPALAQAEAPAPEPSAERDGASLLVELGWYDGAVGGLQLDSGISALRITGGYMPLLLLVSDGWDDGDGSSDAVEYLHAAQFNGELIFYFAAPTARSRVGLSAGYRYNTVLAHGVGLAFQGEGELSAGLGVFYTFGLSWFFDGNDRARRETGIGADDTFNFPFGAGFQGGAGVGLLFGF